MLEVCVEDEFFASHIFRQRSARNYHPDGETYDRLTAKS
jgi:hypothetical protein